MTESNNKQLVRSFFQALSDCDADAMSEIVTRDVIADAKGSSIMSMERNYDAVMETIAGLKQMTKDGVHFEIVSLTEEDDRVSCEAKGFSTLVNGEQYNNIYHFLFHCRDGRICRVNEYFDTKLVDEVLGPIMAP